MLWIIYNYIYKYVGINVAGTKLVLSKQLFKLRMVQWCHRIVLCITHVPSQTYLYTWRWYMYIHMYIKIFIATYTYKFLSAYMCPISLMKNYFPNYGLPNKNCYLFAVLTFCQYVNFVFVVNISTAKLSFPFQ